MQSQSLLQAPFVVSVTGHVDPHNSEELSRIIEQQLRAIRAEAESQEPKPQQFLLLSALAKGADTLAARAAIDLGWQVIAPLPLPLEEYRRDFQGDELAKFNQFVERTPNFFIGYAQNCDENNTQDQSENGIARKLQYAYLGEFLTRHCEVLIACWDGKGAGGIGGTADVVELQLRGVPPHLFELRDDGALLDSPEGGRVIQILTKRHKAPDDEPKPFANEDFISCKIEEGIFEIVRRFKVKQPDTGQSEGGSQDEKSQFVIAESEPEECESTDEVAQQQNGLSAFFKSRFKGTKAEDVQRFKQQRIRWEKFIEESKEKWDGQDERDTLPADSVKHSPYLQKVREAYYRCDALANHLQGQIKIIYSRILDFSLAVTVSVSVAVSWSQSAISTGLLVLTWLLLLAMIIIVRREKESERDVRFQDYRALAEAFRVLFFWRAAGIEEPLDTHYLRGQRSELDWIRAALRVADLQWRAQSKIKSEADSQEDGAADLRRCAQSGFPDTSEEGLRLARTNWVQDQYGYFKGKFPENRIKLTTLRNRSWALMLAGLGATVVGALASAGMSEAFHDNIARGLWRFITTFASAELLASPFLPGALLLSRMENWPLATEDNTKNIEAAQPATRQRLRILRDWFVYQDSMWRLASVALGLCLFGASAAIIVNLVPAAPLVPFLQLTANLCFFSPLLIWLSAEFEGLPENAERYEQMFKIFERAKNLFDRVIKPNKITDYAIEAEDEDDKKKQEEGERIQRARAQRVLIELGRQAIQENGEWLIIKRGRDLNGDF